jgi:exopolyphosphatase/guanosine-5'-triphosphate,3'-diphosphate pyrophosphatase
MYAVLDLGSNSFHLVIAEQRNGKTHILKTMNSKVQLAEGLNQTGKISKEARERALLALKEFREELVKYPILYFCVVGTNTFREAKNAAKLLEEANALGFPINVISGVDEAYYIYQGVQAFLPPSDKQRLIFDIGGGSTEFAVGCGTEPLILDSLPIGCVTYQSTDTLGERDEKITRKTLAKIRRKVHEVLDEKLNPDFYELDCEEIYASSGTAKMLSGVLRENKLTDGTITLKALQELEDRAIDLGSSLALSQLAGLKINRRNVFISGLAIMQSIMDHLGLDHVDYSDFALREGVLLGLIQQGRKFSLYTLMDSKPGKRLL